MRMAARAELLKQVPVFAGLDDTALQRVAEAAVSRIVAAGFVFFDEGDEARAFFVVQSGTIKLTQLAPEGHRVVLRLLGPGEAFGGVAAFSGGTYPVTAEAVTDVTAFEWPGRVMAGLMDRYPRITTNALRFVAARLHELQVRYRQLATEKVERRVARALIRLVQQAGRKVDSGVLIDLPLSREDVAQMTGTTLYTVSRILSRWDADGILDGGRQRIVIRQPHALMKIADDLP
jgi:CRP/FNR family transcriptional regulator, nitrogen oxide reductase regulator